MNKLNVLKNGQALFRCPGCGLIHAISILPGRWSWDQDPYHPTITPSILVKQSLWNAPTIICHSFITGGNIQFLTDSTHALAGRTVELPDYEIT